MISPACPFASSPPPVFDSPVLEVEVDSPVLESEVDSPVLESADVA
jgi:hypothetical protein